MINAIYESLVDLLAQDETNRLERFRMAWRAYYGNLPKPLKVPTGGIDDNIRLNFVKLIVNKSVFFLFGKELQFELDETQRTDAELWLEKTWQANRKMTLLQKVAINGGVCGQTFIKMQYKSGMAFPRLIALDPETVTVTLAADDLEQVRSFKIQYPSKDPKTGKPVGVRQVIERNGRLWKITDQLGNTQNNTWRTVSEENWPYEWAPVFYCQNLPVPNEFWGMSDIEPDILEVNQAVNFTVSNTGRILKYHGHPKTWGRGFEASELQMAVDQTLVFPSPDAELHNLEMMSDLSSAIEFYKRLKEALHEISQTPEVALGKLESVNGLSGLALQILYLPLVEKTETKRQLYGEMLVDLNRRLLEVGGFGAENYTALHWQAMLPVDAKEERETALIDQQLGVSEDTLLTQLGYDSDLERTKKQAESETLAGTLLENFDDGK